MLGFGQQGGGKLGPFPLIYVFERCSEYVHIKVGYRGGVVWQLKPASHTCWWVGFVLTFFSWQNHHYEIIVWDDFGERFPSHIYHKQIWVSIASVSRQENTLGLIFTGCVSQIHLHYRTCERTPIDQSKYFCLRTYSKEFHVFLIEHWDFSSDRHMLVYWRA